MPRIVFCLLWLLLQTAALAQPVYTLTKSPVASIQSVALIPDSGYVFSKIVTDTHLPFVVNDSLRPTRSGAYWLRIVIFNPGHEAELYNVKMFPDLDNTLYYFDANAAAWMLNRSGILAGAGNLRMNPDGMSCIVRAQTTNTIYIKVTIQAPGLPNHVLKPAVTLEKQAVVDRQELGLWITWITSLTVLFLFLLNNAYVWFSFKDKSVGWFLIVQLGGLIYITAYKQVFYALFPCPVFSMDLLHGSVVWYDWNSLLLHASIIIILYGLVHFGRSYFNTRRLFPRLDRILRRGMPVFLVLGSLGAIINAFVYLENYTWYVDNIFAGLFITAILYISVAGYMRRLPAATPFLVANILSLGFMLATTLYHLIADLQHRGYSPMKTFLPDLAIITQTIGFSVALVARTRVLQNSLAVKEVEARQLELDLRELALRHQQIELENQSISTEMQHQKTRNEQLQDKLEANQRELASSTLYIVQKNELLARLKEQINELKKQYPHNRHREFQDIESALQNNLHLEEGWEKFKLHFEQVHPNFFEELKTNHPTLTKNEMRLCAYFHINLATKEIAALQNIDPASVRRAKTRLYKKMGIRNSGKVTEEDGEND